MARRRLTLAESIMLACLIFYLGVGAIFAILPFLFGAYKVALIMLIGWPSIFLR